MQMEHARCKLWNARSRGTTTRKTAFVAGERTTIKHKEISQFNIARLQAILWHMELLSEVFPESLCKSGPGSLWWWYLKFLSVKHVVDVVDVLARSLSPSMFTRINRLKVCHQLFTTFFKFAISKEICHLVLTLGAISRENFQLHHSARGNYSSHP